jgi:hypothetical protein
MADKKRIHVTKHPDGWEAKREGVKRAIAVTETKAPAIDKAISVAKREKGEVILHKEERNTIQEERTYRKDPFPPKG